MSAIALYEWNAEVSSALGTTIGHVEVRPRNAIHDVLGTWSAQRHAEPRWYLDPAALLGEQERADIATARRRATRNGRQETAGRVIAELNLGFWKFLLARRYDRGLWHPCLHKAFRPQRRAVVFDAVDRLHAARNRMAHYEPMCNRPIEGLRDDALQVAGWMCPTTRAWIERRCRVSEVIAVRP